MMPLVLHVADISASGIMWHWWHHMMPMPMVSQDQKCHAVPHFYYLDLGNIYTYRFVQVLLETELIKSIQNFYLEDGIEDAIHQWHWGWLCFAHSLYCLGLAGDRAVWVNSCIKRWSWKGSSSVVLGKPLNICLGLLGDRASAKRLKVYEPVEFY